MLLNQQSSDVKSQAEDSTLHNQEQDAGQNLKSVYPQQDLAARYRYRQLKMSKEVTPKVLSPLNR